MEYNVTYRERNQGIQAIISYKDQYGKWKQKSKQGFQRKKKAKAWADEAIQELKETVKLAPNRDLDGITFKAFADMYQDHLILHTQPYTIKTMKTSLNRFVDLWDLRLDKITIVEVQGIVDGMVREGLKYATIKTYVALLNLVFKAAKEDYNLINNIPTERVKIVKNKETLAKRALEDWEIEKLLQDLEGHKHYMLVFLLLKTGMRIAEAVALTWDDIDFDNSEIDINKQWKPSHEGKYGFGELKSKNSYRQVPVPNYVITELKQHRRITNFDRRVFSYKNTNSLKNSVNGLFKKLGYDFSLHHLRHTYITRLVASNRFDFKTIAQFAGHSVEQTIKRYSHVTESMRKKPNNP